MDDQLRTARREWDALGQPEGEPFRRLRRVQARAGVYREPIPAHHGGRNRCFLNLVTLMEDMLRGRGEHGPDEPPEMIVIDSIASPPAKVGQPDTDACPGGEEGTPGL